MFTLVSNPYSNTRPMFYSWAKPVFWLSLALYLAAFALPVRSGSSTEPGFLVFAFGPILCARAPWLLAGWLANCVYWVALIVVAKRHWQLAARVGGAASCMALSVLLYEGFSGLNLVAWGVGYWSWSGSMVLLTCAAALLAASPVKKGHQYRAA